MRNTKTIHHFFPDLHFQNAMALLAQYFFNSQPPAEFIFLQHFVNDPVGEFLTHRISFYSLQHASIKHSHGSDPLHIHRKDAEVLLTHSRHLSHHTTSTNLSAISPFLSWRAQYFLL